MYVLEIGFNPNSKLLPPPIIIDLDCFAQESIFYRTEFFHVRWKIYLKKYVMIVTFIILDTELNQQSPQSGSNSPSTVLSNGHKQNSLRNTKLARRARSFKDDVIGKIIQIRAPNVNTLSLGRYVLL